MTEIEWLQGTDPQLMLEYLTARASERQLRLLACACCRLWDPALALSDLARRAVETTEQYVDGEASRAELEAASVVAREAYYLAVQQEGHGVPRAWVARLAGWASGSREGHLRRITTMTDPEVERKMGVPREALLPLLRCVLGKLLRCVLGNPFRTICFDPAWLAWGGGTVKTIATAIYQEQTFEQLPILADALEEAGCENQAILGHLRSSSPHCRGCWVLNGLLGKS